MVNALGAVVVIVVIIWLIAHIIVLASLSDKNCREYQQKIKAAYLSGEGEARFDRLVLAIQAPLVHVVLRRLCKGRGDELDDRFN